MSSRVRGSWCGLAVVLFLPGAVSAQARIFPNVPSFERPEASPRVHGLAARVISAQRGDSRFGNEVEGEVALGENFPLLALRRGDRPITLGFGPQVYARFSLTDGRDALISNDWVVGLNGTALLGAWAITVETYHESSHLGDEYEDRFDAERLDWTREVLAAWAATSGSRSGSICNANAVPEALSGSSGCWVSEAGHPGRLGLAGLGQPPWVPRFAHQRARPCLASRRLAT